MPPQHYSDALIGSLMVFGLLSTLPAKILHAAWVTRKSTSKRRATQGLAIAAALTSAALIGALFATQGVGATFGGLHALRQADAVYGWTITIMLYFGLTIPIWALLIGLSAYRNRPSLSSIGW